MSGAATACPSMMLSVSTAGLTFSCTEEAFRYLGSFAGARKLGRSPESELLLTSNVNWRATASASARPKKLAAQLKPAEALKISEREKSSGMGPERLLKLALKYQQSLKNGAVAFVALVRGPLQADMTCQRHWAQVHTRSHCICNLSELS